MAITELYANTATISTSEYSLPATSTSLATITTDGIYQVFIDTANLATGDQYELKIYEKVVSSGSKKAIQTFTLNGSQPGPFVTPTLILINGWDVTLKKLAGTDRAISWSIRQVA